MTTADFTIPSIRQDRQKLVDLLTGAGAAFDGTKCRCIFHDDQHASAGVYQRPGGAWAYKCQGCGINEDIIGIAAKLQNVTSADLLREARRSSPAKPPQTRKRIVATYDYCNAEGELLYQAVRYDPKDFRQRTPDGNGGWNWKLNGVQRVLYRLPQLLNAREDDAHPAICIVEGEKDADRLAGLGLLATSNVGGAGKWRDDYSETLTGFHAIIIPDNDDPGQKHADQVARSLTGKAASVKVLKLPGLPPKGDVSDWLDAGGTRDELLRLAAEAPEWTPPTEPEQGHAGSSSASPADEQVDDDEPNEIELPNHPLRWAESYIKCNETDSNGRLLLRQWRGNHYRFVGSGYRELSEDELNRAIYRHLDRVRIPAIDRKTGEPTGENRPLRVTTTAVRETRSALVACDTLVGGQPPLWIDGRSSPNPARLVPFANGLLDMSRCDSGRYPPLLEPTPELFALNPLPYRFDPHAPEPVEWLRFLGSVWGDDQHSIQCLRQWFGYCLTSDTSRHKALFIVGPKRSGKGTIARVLREMVGEANTCGPTLSSLGSNFGLWPLIGKSLAIIADARLSGRTDQAVVTERILSITGEDALTVDRKNQEPVTLKLNTRIMMLSNELPRLTDNSGALASRWRVLVMNRSFYGEEDLGLLDRLLPEIPAIARWAVDGWIDLQRQGDFTQPGSAIDAIEEIRDLASPIGAFVRDCCDVHPGASVEAATLYMAWCWWCDQQGRDHAGTAQTFGRDLKAAQPGITTRNLRGIGGRTRHYEGIALQSDMTAEVEQFRVKRSGF